MKSELKVKQKYPRAAKKRYTTAGKTHYYLIWSGFPEGLESKRLGQGKTASAAWTDAAKNLAEREAAAAAMAQKETLDE